MTELFDIDSYSKGRSTTKNKGGGRNTFIRGCMIPETVSKLIIVLKKLSVHQLLLFL
jgi:hypothetical protein